MKTVSVALVLSLNVGVDPPDVIKTNPCARMECWVGKYISSIFSHLILYFFASTIYYYTLMTNDYIIGVFVVEIRRLGLSCFTFDLHFHARKYESRL